MKLAIYDQNQIKSLVHDLTQHSRQIGVDADLEQYMNQAIAKLFQNVPDVTLTQILEANLKASTKQNNHDVTITVISRKQKTNSTAESQPSPNAKAPQTSAKPTEIKSTVSQQTVKTPEATKPSESVPTNTNNANDTVDKEATVPTNYTIQGITFAVKPLKKDPTSFGLIYHTNPNQEQQLAQYAPTELAKKLLGPDPHNPINTKYNPKFHYIFTFCKLNNMEERAKLLYTTLDSLDLLPL